MTNKTIKKELQRAAIKRSKNAFFGALVILMVLFGALRFIVWLVNKGYTWAATFSLCTVALIGFTIVRLVELFNEIDKRHP